MSTPYSFQCSAPTSSGDVKRDFHFTTEQGRQYRFSFEPVRYVTSLLDALPVLSDANQVVLEQQQPGNYNGFDPRVGLTVSCICQFYLEHISNNKIFVFQCASYDGKQLHRFHKFNRWFLRFDKSNDLDKIDKQFLEPCEDGTYEWTYISFIFSRKHPYRGKILLELDYFEEEFCSMK